MGNGFLSLHGFGRYKPLLTLLSAVLGLRVLVGILLEYRWYFPANFVESAFLTGREETFTRAYAIAFYTHIISGPPTIVLGTFLVWSQGAGRFRLWHRWAGRVQMVLIFAALLPSGLMMATQAFTGPMAGWGFAALTLATAFCAALAVYYACTKRILLHQVWASRCYVLLISPLILRVVSGALIVTGTESETTYVLNAWLSWLVPLAMYEIWRFRTSDIAAEHNVRIRVGASPQPSPRSTEARE
ncbi:hypothetical protein ETAA8_01460 [Anatilimnocola aggregata]|uniref:DUF2306 domain-containing protein n=2 Tax=Anatilimnocola aggregata TaxID=2528021 RepID=A0A517Y4D2_9BACT|nr:hypothetical protein ETAA8_01460 [Anatilimnocola aggregata]